MSLLADNIEDVISLTPQTLKSLGFRKAAATDDLDCIEEHPHKWVKAVYFHGDMFEYPVSRYKCVMYYYDDRNSLYTLFKRSETNTIISAHETTSVNSSLDIICVFAKVSDIIKQEFNCDPSKIPGLQVNE